MICEQTDRAVTEQGQMLTGTENTEVLKDLTIHLSSREEATGTDKP